MRIISGDCRGRKLTQIQGRDIRPTPDRVREALFNIIGPAIRGQRVLDLFAGTGAFGLEALSRGAEAAVFIDGAQSSCEVIKKNIQLCRMEERSTLLCHDLSARPLPAGLDAFDLIFMDPPYNKGLPEQVLAKEGFINLLAPSGIVIVEQDFKESLALPLKSLDIYRQKKYSKTLVSFLRESDN
ncbi:MAG: 16S rRNA (guanine(966)-N(2))-methyltransferase RsmD [Desulfobacter sp.]|nr:MAG: 16S rRNA (guanine(966)-N(2))-methyltransferase RsmD [Desulfobacter sp.]